MIRLNDVFFIADLHLGHKNVIDYCNRPFDTVEQMNETLIRNWNNKVGKSDKVFFLGDFGLGTSQQIKEWCKRLNGTKTLIRGNHDRYTDTVFYDAGFKEVIKYPILWNEKYILSHAPIQAVTGEPLLNIYGHVHVNTEHEEHCPNSFCVSAERIAYTPISFKEILSELKLRNSI